MVVNMEFPELRNITPCRLVNKADVEKKNPRYTSSRMYKIVTNYMTLTSRISHRHLASPVVEANWNVMAHAQKPDFVFRAKRTSPFKSAEGRQFSRLLAAEVCASAVVMLDTPCSEVVWRVLATHSIRQFPLHLPTRASPCATTFQLESIQMDWIQYVVVFLYGA